MKGIRIEVEEQNERANSREGLINDQHNEGINMNINMNMNITIII